MNIQVMKKHQSPLVWDAPLAGLMETIVGFDFLFSTILGSVS